jgi:hypothetical protein
MKLNVYTYTDTIERGRCGNSDTTEEFIFITHLSELDFQRKLVDFVNQQNTICYSKFLISIDNFGILLKGGNDFCADYITGGWFGKEINLNQLNAKEIVSDSKYSEIIEARREAEEIKRQQIQQQRLVAEQLARQRRLEEARELLENSGYVVSPA